MVNDYNLKRRKVFDTHSHIGKFGKWVMKGNSIEPFKGREISNAKEQKSYMGKLKITKAIVMPHYTPNQSVPFDKFNPVVLNVCSKLKNVYGALWVSPLEENADKTNKVLDILPKSKVVALKMSPDSWPRGISYNPKTWNKKFKMNIKKIINAVKKHNLVLHTHTGSGNSDIREYVPFVEQYGKGLKIQFVHMGGSAGGHFAFVPRFIGWLKKGYDFYCDTSFCKGFGPAWLVNDMQKKYSKGLDKILFASDNPWGIFESEFWRIEAINCSDKIKNKIFYENACKLYC